jgi:hypothetical protein
MSIRGTTSLKAAIRAPFGTHLNYNSGNNLMGDAGG